MINKHHLEYKAGQYHWTAYKIEGDFEEVIPQSATWDICVHKMDDGIREQVANELAPCSNILFLISYLEFHDLELGPFCV